MKMIFSMFDKKAKAYAPPFAAENVQVLKRQLAVEVGRADSMLSHFPTDYEIYHLGYFDAPSGSITVNKNPDFCFSMAEITPAPMSGAEVVALGKQIAAEELKKSEVKADEQV